MLRIEDILDEASRYIRDEMSMEEKAFFEELLDQHPKLRQDVVLMKKVKNGLFHLKEEPLAKSRNRRWFIFTGAAIVTLVLFHLLQHFLNQSEIDNSFIRPQYPSNRAFDNQASPLISIERLGGDANSNISDRGQALGWLDTGQLAFSATFMGSGKVGKTSFSSHENRDMLFGVIDLNAGIKWLAVVGGEESPDIPRSLAISNEGDINLTGGFGGDINFGGQLLQAKSTDNLGRHEIFVAQYSGLGELKWISNFGGNKVDNKQTGNNIGLAITTDSNDNVLLSTAYIGHPVIGEISLPEGGPNEDLALIKYTKKGQLRWVYTITSDFMVYGKGVATDADNNIYLTGSFGHHNLGGQSFFSSDTILLSLGGRDIFSAKFNPNGELLWARRDGSRRSSNGQDQASAIAVDQAGNSYIAGSFSDTMHLETGDLISYGGRDICLLKLAPDGKLLWAQHAGSAYGSGKQSEQAEGIAIAPNGDILLTGSFTNIAQFDTQQLQTAGDSNFFIARYTSAGELKTVRQFVELEGFQQAGGQAVVVNSDGQIAVTGYFSGKIAFDGQELNSLGSEDIFLLVLDERLRRMSATHLIAQKN